MVEFDFIHSVWTSYDNAPGDGSVGPMGGRIEDAIGIGVIAAEAGDVGLREGREEESFGRHCGFHSTMRLYFCLII